MEPALFKHDIFKLLLLLLTPAPELEPKQSSSKKVAMATARSVDRDGFLAAVQARGAGHILLNTSEIPA